MRWLRTWRMPLTLGLMTLGIAIDSTVLVVLVVRTSASAEQGKAARVQQCSFFPTGLKEQRDFYQRGKITAAELAKYTRFGPYCAAVTQAARQP